MKTIICFRILLPVLFLLFSTGTQAQLKYLQEVKELPPHPRILMLQGEEQQIRANIAADPIWNKMHQAIMKECDQMVLLPELERIQKGRRLLSVSREAIRRIFYLSYAYRMNGQDRYLRKAEKEMLAVSAFSDWNPSHFLDVAEMTMAVAIGYDWLYDQLSATSRKTVRDAILSKGIDPSLNSNNAWFLTATHNWNQVCNAGMAYGALAIYEDMPHFSGMIIDRAIETIHLPMHDYAPDGAYPEGYGYWGYGTSFNVMFLSAIEKVLKTDFGLSQLPGFIETASYLENMTGPTGLCYNYADCGNGGGINPAMFWFAARSANPSLLWEERKHLEHDKNQTKERLLPAALIWGSNIRIANIQPPEKTIWVGHGTTPVALMRSSWTDPKALFVGFKGGTASSNHAHMDAGSFIMEADGVRWAMDFGMQDYHSLESKGVSIWGRAQNAERWQVFRYNNFVHNTLTVDNQLHRVEGYADIISHSASPVFMNAVSDISKIFEGQLAGCVRGIGIIDKQYVIVRDELKTLDKATTVRWTMLTSAESRITGKNTIELKKDGKKLTLRVTEPAQVSMKTWSTEPPHDYDARNPGTTLVGFEVQVPANKSLVLAVELIPQKVLKTMSKIPELEQWPK